MIFYKSFVCALLLIMAVPLMTALSYGATEGEAIGPEKGEGVFNARCSPCHGPKAGGTEKGPPLVHVIYRPDHHSDLSFRWAVERGVRAHHWRFGDMPKVEGLRSEEVESVIQYIRELQKKAGIF